MQPTSYYARHRAIILQKLRRSRLTTKGGQVLRGLVKRPHPDHCEICANSKNQNGLPLKLEYHHWFPGCPEVGMWICFKCHKIAETVESDSLTLFMQLYTKLKAQIEKESYDRHIVSATGAPS
ncbi:unnamed protein product [marine sediment metagenome]|uniref:Uncharacterized protein n=1 Tax=marine sediment metagenome TaxID=412755 RepID=X1J674_9ZZZZ